MKTRKAELYVVKQIIVEWVCPYCGIANRQKTWQNLLKEIKTMRCENCLELSEKI